MHLASIRFGGYWKVPIPTPQAPFLPAGSGLHSPHAGPVALCVAWHFRPLSFQGGRGGGDRDGLLVVRQLPSQGHSPRLDSPGTVHCDLGSCHLSGPHTPACAAKGKAAVDEVREGAGPEGGRCPRGPPALEQAAPQRLWARARGRELCARALRRAREATARGTAESSAGKTRAGVGESQAVLPRAITRPRGRRGGAELTTRDPVGARP